MSDTGKVLKGAGQPQNSFVFKTFDAEMFFVRRLKEHGKRVLEGVTTSEITKERIRQALIDAKVDCTICGRNAAGKAETYAQAFERHFGEPLEPKSRKGKTTC